MNDLPNLIILVGPTAVGKTTFAIQLAKRLDAEIVSADSRLFYRGLDIGTAKPSPEERQGVPHHLIDIADPDELISLPQFQEQARQAIKAIHQRKHLPILVGGSGQYIRAVVQGWQGPAAPPNLMMRAALEAWALEIGPTSLHEKLRILDPLAAQIIDPPNVRRTIRALEVIFTTGKPFSAQRQQGEKRFRSLMIGLTRSRAELYQRIDARIESMFTTGFVEEVRRLLDKGYSPELPTLSAIGYREVIAYLAGKITLEEAKAQMRRQTRVFVRRQANWFNLNDPEILWLAAADPGEENADSALSAAEETVRRFLTEG